MNSVKLNPVKLKLGELLVEQQLLTKDELFFFLDKAKQKNKKLGRVLVEAQRISEPVLVQTLANQLGLPFVDLTQLTISHQIAQLLPETIARRCVCLLINRQQQEEGGDPLYTIAMSDPADIVILEDIQKNLPTGDFEIVAATEDQIYPFIDRLYRKTEDIAQLSEALTREVEDRQDIADLTQLLVNNDNDAPVVKLLQSIFADAVAHRASDIHIEPMEKALIVRIRVDGLLHQLLSADVKNAPAVAQRLKLISGLNISEKRLPQDGRFNIKVHKNVIDVRIATTPTTFGEAIVMRLLHQHQQQWQLSDLKMPPSTQQHFLEALNHSQGLILVTGPTGSGKTTTLYSGLSYLNQPTSKLITIEDPVEYRIPGVNQIQIHEKIGLTFNHALRSVLRQDPDIILVGEMRDQDTVEAALRASMTGHLVLSTLHTNDAASAALRLLDLQAEPFIVSQTLSLVLAQRLIRLNCPHCIQPYEPTDTEQEWSNHLAKQSHCNTPPLWQASSGCEQCSYTGYFGRQAVYEHLHMNHDLRTALNHGSESFIHAARHAMGYQTLPHQANLLARQGLVQLKDARRIF